MTNIITAAAVEAWERGYVPIPLITRDKKPGIPTWTRATYDSADEVKESFDRWDAEGKGNLGVLLGTPSGGLVDVDIDHPKASRMRDFFLPSTPARSGRAGRRNTHYWYVCKEGTVPGSTRQHLMPRVDGKRGPVAVELRSTLGQTAIPPSIHPSGEDYIWEGEPWGGEEGPAVIDGRVLAARVAMLGLSAVLLDHWPQKGTRHEAYLALAGGLLSYGEMTVHPFWGGPGMPVEQLIRALADATMDDDGADARVHESVTTTVANIRAGKRVVGLGTLVDIIGEEHVKQVRILVAEVEQAAGFVSRQAAEVVTDSGGRGELDARLSEIAATPMEDRDPLGERISSWQPVDLEPYLSGRIKPVEPTVMQRTDGQYLMYPGRVNMLAGSSESAKSWIALGTVLQVMANGERAMFLDFEDEPVNTLNRLALLGAGHDDLRKQFTYIRPEDPLSDMQRDSWGKAIATPEGQKHSQMLWDAIEAIDPTFIVADGMTALYGLHGLSTNDTSETDVITSWLKRLTRNGRSTVLVIDHTNKGSERGSMPTGSQHKVSMVQGTLMQAWMIKQPMPGSLGEIELVVLKDRPGEVRKASQNAGGSGKVQIAALVKIDSTQPGRTDLSILPPPNPLLGSTVVVNLAQQRAAEAAQLRAEEEDMILYAFRGQLGKRLTSAQLSQMTPPGFFFRTMKADGSGYNNWQGPGWRALKRLMSEKRKQGQYIMPLGATQNREYELIIGDDSYDMDMPDWDPSAQSDPKYDKDAEIKD